MSGLSSSHLNTSESHVLRVQVSLSAFLPNSVEPLKGSIKNFSVQCSAMGAPREARRPPFLPISLLHPLL